MQEIREKKQTVFMRVSAYPEKTVNFRSYISGCRLNRHMI